MGTKRCFKCEREVPVDQFYRHPRMADGRLNKCKTCTKRDVTENYAKRRKQFAEYERRRTADPVRRAKRTEYQRRSRERNRKKYVARRRVSQAVRSGVLVPRPCENCGSVLVQAHHSDYDKPIQVSWLCFSCHLAEHGKACVAKSYRGTAFRARKIGDAA